MNKNLNNELIVLKINKNLQNIPNILKYWQIYKIKFYIVSFDNKILAFLNVNNNKFNFYSILLKELSFNQKYFNFLYKKLSLVKNNNILLDNNYWSIFNKSNIITKLNNNLKGKKFFFYHNNLNNKDNLNNNNLKKITNIKKKNNDFLLLKTKQFYNSFYFKDFITFYKKK